LSFTTRSEAGRTRGRAAGSAGRQRDRRAAARSRASPANPRRWLRRPGSGRSPAGPRAHRRPSESAPSSRAPPGCRWQPILLQVRLYAEAVKLDFVDPASARRSFLAQHRMTRLDESGERRRLRAGNHAGVNTPSILRHRYMATRAPGAERFPVSPSALPSARPPLATVGRVRRGLF
jgi:hypothetical protein